THVEKESIARPDERNAKMKRVTNKLQTIEQPGPTERAIPTTGLTIKGDGLDQDIDGTKGTKNEIEKRQKFVLELPDLARRDAVHLKPGEGPGIGNHVANRSSSEAMKGNSNHFNLQLGSGTDEQGGESGGGKKGATD